MKKLILSVTLVSLLPFAGTLFSNINQQEEAVIGSKLQQFNSDLKGTNFEKLLTALAKERPETAAPNSKLINAIREDFNTNILPDMVGLLAESIQKLKEDNPSLQITDEKTLDQLLATSPYFAHLHEYWLSYLDGLAQVAQEWDNKALPKENVQD